MSERLANTIALYALFLAVAIAVSAGLRRGRPRTLDGGLVLLELALLAQAGIAIVALVGGDRPADPAMFGGYLAASVLVLPAAVGYGRGRSGWDAAIVALGCVALAVVAWRLLATWAA